MLLRPTCSALRHGGGHDSCLCLPKQTQTAAAAVRDTPQVTVTGATLGAWGKEKYGLKPTKASAHAQDRLRGRGTVQDRGTQLTHNPC